MYQGDSFTLMASYNVWMNGKLYGLAAELPDDKRKQDLGAFFKSLHGTLNHLLFADQVFLSRFTGSPMPHGEFGSDLYEEFESLRTEREATDADILDWITNLDRDALAEPFTFTSMVDGVTRTLPKWVMMTQMFNHQTHHRGQATTLLKQLGVDPGITDIPWLPALYADTAPRGG